MFYKSAEHSCNEKINPMIYKPAAHGKLFTFAETRLHIRQGWYIFVYENLRYPLMSCTCAASCTSLCMEGNFIVNTLFICLCTTAVSLDMQVLGCQTSNGCSEHPRKSIIHKLLVQDFLCKYNIRYPI